MHINKNNHTNIIVETRALIDEIPPIETALKNLNAKLISNSQLTDYHYANLESVDPDKHTWEEVGRAARIRVIKSDANGGEQNRVEVMIRKALPELKDTRESHDSSSIEFFETHPPDTKIENLEKILFEKGFPHSLTQIKKTRKTYSLENTIIFLEDIEGFGPALEIKNQTDSPADVKKIKQTQLELLKKLNVPESEVIRTSHTHMIIDSRLKKDPKIKIPALEKELKELEEKKEELMALTHDYAVNEGDGWHDNAALDKLYEDVSIVTIRIRNLKKAIFEANKEVAQ